jgi:hypothetical protein
MKKTIKIEGRTYEAEGTTLRTLGKVIPQARASGDFSAVRSILEAGLATGRIVEVIAEEHAESVTEAKEFILWATPKGETDALHAQPIYTQGKSMADVERVKGLAAKEGWHSFKVQTLDISQPFDAGQAFRKAINPPSKWKKPSAKTESVDEAQEDTLEEESSGREQQVRAAMKQAKEIRAEAKKRGVTFWLTGDTSVAAKKEFTKGDIDAFHKAYHDCTAVLSLVKLGSGENEWGCSSAGVGTGAQECVKSGVVTRNKSGMGGKILLQVLDGKKFYDSRGMPIRE